MCVCVYIVHPIQMCTRIVHVEISQTWDDVSQTVIQQTELTLYSVCPQFASSFSTSSSSFMHGLNDNGACIPTLHFYDRDKINPRKRDYASYEDGHNLQFQSSLRVQFSENSRIRKTKKHVFNGSTKKSIGLPCDLESFYCRLLREQESVL